MPTAPGMVAAARVWCFDSLPLALASVEARSWRKL
jgi:hypothetical protein